MRYPVENNSSHRNLSAVGLSPGFGGDHPCQERYVAALGRAAGGGGDAKGLQRGRAADAVSRQAVFLLKIFDRLDRGRTVNTVHCAGVIPPVLQFGLDGDHCLAGGALPIGGCKGGLQTGIGHKHQCRRQKQSSYAPAKFSFHMLKHLFVAVYSLVSVRRRFLSLPVSAGERNFKLFVNTLAFCPE